MIGRVPYRSRSAGFRLALLALTLSAAFQFFCFRHWPGAPMFDLGYSILAAQNLIAHGQLASLNMLADYRDDLAQAAQMRFLVHFPPGQSLLYAAVMSLGLSPGAATKILVLLGILFGGAGWIVLARYLKASSVWLVAIALAYPWFPFTAPAYLLYETEHVAAALMPWFCLVLLRMGPVSSVVSVGRELDRKRRPQTQRLVAVVALALVLVLVKYSLAPVFLGAALYLLSLDGREVIRRPWWWQMAIAGMIAAPVLLGLLVSAAYGPRVMATATPQQFSAGTFLIDSFVNSIAAPTGWSGLFRRYLLGLGWYTTRLVSLVAALAVLATIILHLRARPLRGRLCRFAVLMLCLTVAVWLGLTASSIAGQGQWNFSASDRLYRPVVSLWLLFAIVALARLRVRDLIRSPAVFLCAIPVTLIALLLLRDSWVRTPHPAMPQSQIAWAETGNTGHAGFLAGFARSRTRRPDLMIGPSALMNEIEVPSMGNGYFVPSGHHYWSSRPIEVWALILPTQRDKLLASFSGSPVTQVDTPAGYPFEFYIFTLRPR